jgi:hypothetical protein
MELNAILQFAAVIGERIGRVGCTGTMVHAGERRFAVDKP